MTTATEPPLIDEPSIGVDDMPALDQPDERVCQIPYPDRHCQNAAAWVVSADCSLCGVEARLTCDRCKRRMDRCRVVCCVDGRMVTVTWIEAL